MPIALETPLTLSASTSYSDAATLGPSQNLEKIVFTITGGVAVFQVAKLDPTGKPQFDGTEIQCPAGTWGLDNIYGIRFRSRDAINLSTLQVCSGYFVDDPDPYAPGNVPGTTTLTSTVEVQWNDSVVGTEPAIDFEDSGGVTWIITDDAPNTRIKIAVASLAVPVADISGAGTAGHVPRSNGSNYVDGPLDVGDLGGTGFSNNQIPVWNGSKFVAGSLPLTTNTVQLAADVALTSANTFYDGPSLTVNTGIGVTETLFITTTITVLAVSSGNGKVTAKLVSGSGTVYSSTEQFGQAGDPISITLSGIIQHGGGLQTYKIQVATTGVNGAIKAAAPDNGAGNNASTLTAIRLA